MQDLTTLSMQQVRRAQKYFKNDPVGTLLPNSVGTASLLNLAHCSKTKGFLFISSGEVYGQPAVEIMKETDYGYLDPAQVRSCYAESKRFSGDHVRILAPPVSSTRFYRAPVSLPMGRE